MMIHWLIPLLVIPSILLLVVFLLGFAGCGFTGAGGGITAADPSDFIADQPPEADHIQLSWKDNGTNTTHFRLRRREAGDEGQTITIEGIPAITGHPPIDITYTDSLDIKPATAYEYRLFAVVVNVQSTGLVLVLVTTPP